MRIIVKHKFPLYGKQDRGQRQTERERNTLHAEIDAQPEQQEEQHQQEEVAYQGKEEEVEEQER